VDSLGDKPLTQPCTEKLLHWFSLQLAAATRSLALQAARSDNATCDTAADAPPNPATLRELCLDLTRLRRAELHAERLALERQWLALERSKTAEQKEKEFWAWTKRKDIRAKLQPKKTEPDIYDLAEVEILRRDPFFAALRAKYP
jgi:hypothetical protein